MHAHPVANTLWFTPSLHAYSCTSIHTDTLSHSNSPTLAHTFTILAHSSCIQHRPEQMESGWLKIESRGRNSKAASPTWAGSDLWDISWALHVHRAAYGPVEILAVRIAGKSAISTALHLPCRLSGTENWWRGPRTRLWVEMGSQVHGWFIRYPRCPRKWGVNNASSSVTWLNVQADKACVFPAQKKGLCSQLFSSFLKIQFQRAAYFEIKMALFKAPSVY